MPCDHFPVSIFPNAFTYISINGEQVMTLGAVSLVAHTSGVLPIDRGGTGGTTPEQARTNLGLGSAATFDASAFATAAQGARATTALQPGDDAAALGSRAAIPAGYALTADGAGGADWARGAALPAATQAEMEAGTESALRAMSPLLTRQGEDARFAAPPILGSTTPNRGDFTEVRLNNNADPVNFERFSLSWSANVATIATAAGGTGSERDIVVSRNGIVRQQWAAGATAFNSAPGQDAVGLGTELLTTADWTSGAGWVVTVPGTFRHTPGQTATLTHSANISAARHKLSCTITGRTTGSITLAFGGFSFAGVSATDAWGPTTKTTAGLVITPTSDFDGTITVSLVRILTAANATTVYRNAAGNNTMAIRTTAVVSNFFMGVNTGRWSFGTNNVGVHGLQSVTSGDNNTVFGFNALNLVFLGDENTAIGSQTHGSGEANQCVAVGFQAARFIADGITSNIDATQGVYIGHNARASAAAQTNEIVLGAGAIGIGSNTAVLGNASITKTRLQGTVETTLDFESITNGKGVLLRSPNGTRYRISVNDAGAVIATAAP